MIRNSFLLLGVTGVGKTYSLRTFLDAGLDVFIAATEPGIEVTLGDTDPAHLHWHYLPPISQSWDVLIKGAKRLNTLPFKSLASNDSLDKSHFTQTIAFLETCNNFTCDRTGESFGDVAEWDASRVFAVDSLSGLSEMVMYGVAGTKPVRSQADWGMAMAQLETIISKLVTDTRCSFVLTAHVDREVDEIAGGTSIMPATLGRRLAPKIPRYFDDVVYVKREGTTFSWSTTESNMALKARTLPFSATIPPTFAPYYKEEATT